MMGRRFLALAISLCFMLQTCFGATVTIREMDIIYSFDKAAGSRVYIEAKEGSDIQGWQVKSEGVTLDAQNSFIMPENNVEIEAVYPKYTLTVENFDAISSSLKEAGSRVTAVATTAESQIFINWTSPDVILEYPEHQTITFTKQ